MLSVYYRVIVIEEELLSSLEESVIMYMCSRSLKYYLTSGPSYYLGLDRVHRWQRDFVAAESKAED